LQLSNCRFEVQTTERTVAASGAKIAGELPAKAVCVVCIGATIGKVGLTTRPSTTNQQINSVLCSDRHSPEYLYYALLHRARHILAIAGVNATPQLNKTEFSKYRLPMPADRDEENAIAAQLSTFDELIEAKRATIAALQRLKKSLVQNLLTGRMRLSAETIAALSAPAISPPRAMKPKPKRPDGHRSRKGGIVAPELRALAAQLVSVREQARAAGLFTDDRELLTCPGCGLMEDVAFGGQLLTCRAIGGADTGLRFGAEKSGHFRCPACGALASERAEGPGESC
jgi:hypothetical protein